VPGVRQVPMKGSYNFLAVDEQFTPWLFLIRDVIWNDLTNITASSDSASFSEPLGQTWRLYRVAQ